MKKNHCKLITPESKAIVNPSTCMQLDPSAGGMDYQDALSERLSKASSVVHCLLADDHWEHLNDVAVSNALWTVETLLEEAQAMSNAAWENRP